MITAIGLIKNSADIIESFIRCNANVVDNFVLLNNMSTDRTMDILDSLKKEGYQIEVIPDNIIAHTQSVKLTNLLYYTKKKYDSDLFVPIDDDEVIFSPNSGAAGSEINYYLKNLRNSRDLHYLRWRVYFPFDHDDANEICVPKRQTLYFDGAKSSIGKCIVSNKLLEDGSFQLLQGNHGGNGNLIENRFFYNDLLMGHYPCRSTEQVTSKATLGWLSNLANKNRGTTWAYHRKQIFDIIKSGTPVSNALMKLMAFKYLELDSADMDVNKEMIPLPAECFKISYTNLHEFDTVKNLILYAEDMAKKSGTGIPAEFYTIPDTEDERFQMLIKLCEYTEEMAIRYAENITEVHNDY